MPTTENDRRNRQEVEFENMAAPDPQRRNAQGMHSAQPSSRDHQPDLIEESELPAVEVSMASGILTRNSEETGELNESFPGEDGADYVAIEDDEPDIDAGAPPSVDHDNNR